MSDLYGFDINEYCDRHYIKYFKTKYSERQWQVAEAVIKEYASRPHKSREETNKFNKVCGSEERFICKGEFAIPQTEESAQSSGNRFIAYVDVENEFTHVLLIYKKQDHVRGDHETAWWKGVIQDVYPELADLL